MISAYKISDFSSVVLTSSCPLLLLKVFCKLANYCFTAIDAYSECG